ncbi:MAG: DUF928 domain-containing protein [Cyanobacteria bacterium J06642_2]
MQRSATSSKKRFRQVSLGAAAELTGGTLALLLGVILTQPAWAGTSGNSSSAKPSAPPTSPNTGTPEGNSEPTITRSPGGECPKTDIPLTSLVARQGDDLTQNAQPTLWFYLPYEAEDIREVELIVVDELGQHTLFQTSVEMQQSPGFLDVQVYPHADNVLTLGTNYQVTLNVYCDRSEQPNAKIESWIQRRASSVTETPYVYDRANDLLSRFMQTPEDAETVLEWQQLTSDFGLTHLNQEPFVRAIGNPL